MEKNIEILDQNTIDKIAAGEVVERPASVAKELIENAIDSGADGITIEIKNGGIDFIRITDNGCGIPADQVKTAFLRHATSKLRSINDLIRISSLGFRGEALSSISAVSKVEMITRTRELVTGVRYIIEGGFEVSFEEIGAPYGTTVIMRHLFYNTPARAAFLKSAVSEQNAITAYVEQLALSHPEISFKYITNGKTRLYTTGSGDLKDAVYQIYGKDAAKQLFPIDITTSLMRISGYLGKPEAARNTRSFEIYFVNGRYVKSRIIAKAVEDAYAGSLMQHRFPFVVLNLDIDKTKVDVNVHPAKLELRFSDQEEIYKHIFEHLKTALLENRTVPQIVPKTVDNKKIVVNTPVADKSVIDVKKQPEEPKPEKKQAPEPFEYSRRTSKQDIPKVKEEKQYNLFDRSAEAASKKIYYKVIGQVFETFFMVEADEVLYIIDQHAAHEKVFYEKLMKSLKEQKIYSQMLMPAVIISPPPSQADVLRENLKEFEAFGFELEEFGGNDFKITAVPSDFYGVDVNDLFYEILNNLEEPKAGEPNVISERIALRSCKSAVKANMRFTAEDAKILVNELFKLEDPYHCPHGRPTMISLTHNELDRRFKRIL